MQQLSNEVQDRWIRPWDTEKFDDLYDRDERFFSILVKGVLSFLTRNIVLYGKPIKHAIWNTGSSLMYMESNGYEYSPTTVSGEDWIYNEMPRCTCEFSEVEFPQEDLSNPYVRGTYERRSGDTIKGYNAEMRRIPVDININLHYVLANMNESLILIQEIADKMLFTNYFSIVYLGRVIECSIEFQPNSNIQVNKVDMESTETNQKTLDYVVKVSSNYPRVNVRTEESNSNVIGKFETGIFVHPHMDGPRTDKEKHIVK